MATVHKTNLLRTCREPTDKLLSLTNDRTDRQQVRHKFVANQLWVCLVMSVIEKCKTITYCQKKYRDADIPPYFLADEKVGLLIVFFFFCSSILESLWYDGRGRHLLLDKCPMYVMPNFNLLIICTKLRKLSFVGSVPIVNTAGR